MKLNTLQKKFLKNAHDAKEIKIQADAVKDSASNTHEKTKKVWTIFLFKMLNWSVILFLLQLRNQYKQANDTLTSKSASSEAARERAQQLLMRASRITVDTHTKLKELRGKFEESRLTSDFVKKWFAILEMVAVATSNDADLTMMEQKVVRLNGEIDAYIQRIRDHADRYRQCTS